MTVTRFPPSPTGYLHIGGARTALYSWLHARQHQGTFVLRIEDTDLERSTQESIQAILDGMEWLGLDYDQGPFYQTDRFDRYREVVQQLLDSGHAYYCDTSKEQLDEMRTAQKARGEKPKYDGRCRDLGLPEADNTVVRFKNPLDGDVVIHDAVKGDIVISNTQLDDLVIARADGVPTYNLTVVVDDMDMGITHVIRGDDHINNTPRQINILTALDAPLPEYAHVPMILGEDGGRLSKRHGAVSVMQYREDGFLPEALLNYLVRLGWSHGDQELFSQQELLSLFDINTVSRAASTFNPEKLLWVNQEKIKQLSPQELLERSKWHFENMGAKKMPNIDDYALAVTAFIQERCKTLRDVVEQTHFFFNKVDNYDEAAIKKWVKPITPSLMADLISGLDGLFEWTAEQLQAQVQKIVDTHQVSFAKVAQPVRIAITGSINSPSIDHTLALLGRETSMVRLSHAKTEFEKRLAQRQ